MEAPQLIAVGLAMLDHPDIAQELIERSGVRAAQA